MYRVLSAAALTGKQANETEDGIFTSRTGRRAGKYTGGQIKRIVNQMETCPVAVFVAPASNPYGNTHGDTTRTVLSSVEHLDIFTSRRMPRLKRIGGRTTSLYCSPPTWHHVGTEPSLYVTSTARDCFRYLGQKRVGRDKMDRNSSISNINRLMFVPLRNCLVHDC